MTEGLKARISIEEMLQIVETILREQCTDSDKCLVVDVESFLEGLFYDLENDVHLCIKDPDPEADLAGVSIEDVKYTNSLLKFIKPPELKVLIEGNPTLQEMILEGIKESVVCSIDQIFKEISSSGIDVWLDIEKEEIAYRILLKETLNWYKLKGSTVNLKAEKRKIKNEALKKQKKELADIEAKAQALGYALVKV